MDQVSGPAHVDVLRIVLRRIQKLNCNLVATSLRQKKILGCIQSVLKVEQDAVCRHSGALSYVIHGWRTGRHFRQ